MAQKNSNKKNPMEPMSTQSEESGKFRKLLNNSDSSNKDEKVEKVENFDWVPLKHGPFYAVGMQGQGYTLVLAGQAVSPEKYKTIAAAQKAVDEKRMGPHIRSYGSIPRRMGNTKQTEKKSKTWQLLKHSEAKDSAPETK